MKKTKAILSAVIALCLGVSSMTTAFAADEVTLNYEKIGDFNSNKVVDISDVTALQMHLAGYDAVAESAMHMTDFNGDSLFDVNDVTESQKMLAGLDYTCYAEMDSSYLDIKVADSYDYPSYIENQIEFENVLNSDKLFPVVINKSNFKSGFLIESKEQFAHLFGATSTDFDTSFFEEYSLYIWYNYCGDPKYDRKVTEMGIENNQLIINRFNFYETCTDLELRVWTSFYKVKKSDIKDIESMRIDEVVMTFG